MLTRKERRYRDVHVNQDFEMKVFKSKGEEHFKYIISGTKEHIVFACTCLLATLLSHKAIDYKDVDYIYSTIMSCKGDENESE